MDGEAARILGQGQCLHPMPPPRRCVHSLTHDLAFAGQEPRGPKTAWQRGGGQLPAPKKGDLGQGLS